MALTDLRILRLEAENVKRLKAVEITPKGELVTITGKNGQGKTSVLDCILWALGGTKPIQWKPIRDGEAGAIIVLDIGNDDGLKLRVTRKFIAKEDGEYTTSLKVVNEDGFRPEGEQTLLNTIVGALSFDPSAFVRAKPEDQVSLLKSVIPGADFDAIAKKRKDAYDARADANREEKRVRAQAMSIEIPEELGDRIEVEPLMAELSSIGEKARAAAEEQGRRDRARDRIQQAHIDADAFRDEAEELRKRAADLDAKAAAIRHEAEEQEKVLEALPAIDDVPDVQAIRDKIENAEAVNRWVDRAEQRAALIKEADDHKAEADRLTAAIEAADKEVVDLIAAADLPVRGLEIRDDAVWLRGVPFNQASDAEQLRAAMALGMAANPRLRVIRIRDGSLLDEDALEVIREVAKDEGFQIWMEKVGRGDGPEEIIMEDGQIKAIT